MVIMWSTVSALFVLAIWGMSELLDYHQQSLTFVQWLIYVGWLLWAVFGVAFVWTAITENERRAMRVGTLFFGGISVFVIVILVGIWF
jgi:hypothetical protein